VAAALSYLRRLPAAGPQIHDGDRRHQAYGSEEAGHEPEDVVDPIADDVWLAVHVPFLWWTAAHLARACVGIISSPRL
jgi:hypothetical protein